MAEKPNIIHLEFPLSWCYWSITLTLSPQCTTKLPQVKSPMALTATWSGSESVSIINCWPQVLPPVVRLTHGEVCLASCAPLCSRLSLHLSYHPPCLWLWPSPYDQLAPTALPVHIPFCYNLTILKSSGMTIFIHVCHSAESNVTPWRLCLSEQRNFDVTWNVNQTNLQIHVHIVPKRFPKSHIMCRGCYLLKWRYHIFLTCNNIEIAQNWTSSTCIS